MTKHELEQMITTLMEENQRLQQCIADLERELTNMRKPPSSDMTKSPKAPPSPSVFGSRTAGGQLGHPTHERAAFPPEDVITTHTYTLSSCPHRGGMLSAAEQAPKVIQQVEIGEMPIRIEEHDGVAFWCLYTAVGV